MKSSIHDRYMTYEECESFFRCSREEINDWVDEGDLIEEGGFISCASVAKKAIELGISTQRINEKIGLLRELEAINNTSTKDIVHRKRPVDWGKSAIECPKCKKKIYNGWCLIHGTPD